MRFLLSLFSVGLLALGGGLIVDSSVIEARALGARTASSALRPQAPQAPSPAAPGVRIQLIDSARLADNGFGPLEAWSLGCADGLAPAGRPRVFASR